MVKGKGVVAQESSQSSVQPISGGTVVRAGRVRTDIMHPDSHCPVEETQLHCGRRGRLPNRTGATVVVVWRTALGSYTWQDRETPCPQE